MKTYSIPITWQSYDRFNVEAENLQDAVTKALKQFLSIQDECYIQDSFDIDGIIEDDYPDETFDMNKILNEI